MSNVIPTKRIIKMSTQKIRYLKLANAERKLDEAEGLFAEAEDILYTLLNKLGGEYSWARNALKDREDFLSVFSHPLSRRDEYYEFFEETKDLFTAYTEVYDLAVNKFEEAEALRDKKAH